MGIGALALGPRADPASASAPPPASPTVEAPPSITLLSYRRVSRWAYPQVAAIARATPSAHGRRVTRLRFLTPDGLNQAQIYQALREERDPKTGVRWIDLSLPRRPNGTTGWVPARALGKLHVAYGLIVVDRSRRRATLFNGRGKTIFSAPVGIGRPSLPTPAGRFYVLEKWRLIPGGFLGPFGLGTSAYAPTLTDWPGGGVVGIHGTDQPQLIPGDPSHGCVRLRNREITRLWHMVSLGTAIEIT
ncbi:MAG: L,D-transpeptidase [Actinomycetota bacterium]|nr:L,D-transpeptidase [Actinomycetota bacterium]